MHNVTLEILTPSTCAFASGFGG
ncbi:MAG: hypothetical protein RL476_449, partial [Actinomycetota bacterium]